MKRIVSLIILLSPLWCFSQEGKVFDNLSVPSEILKTGKNYSVYLPPDYETSQRDYPVLYLLHGGGGNHTEWVQRGEVKFITDKAIAEGSATPMIIVMPDAGGPKRGYFNWPDGSWSYEDFFFREFMPYIEKTYRVRPGKRHRAIAGLSMGGGGAFIYALHHPELFSACCPLSFATFPLTLEQAKELPRRYPGITEDQIIEYTNTHSIIELINAIPEKRKNEVRWYLDMGDDDALEQVYEGNCLVHITMREKGIPHEFRVRDGAHTWDYWRTALPAVLAFVTISFHN